MNNKIIILVCFAFTFLSFTFPENHSFHSKFGIEWVYFVGHVKTKANQEFGYELSFFRLAIVNPNNEERVEIFPVHFALSSAEKRKHISFQTKQRSFGDLASYSQNTIYSGEYTLKILNEKQFQILAKPKFSNSSVDFMLSASGKPLIHGENGLSKKSRKNPNYFSYYYSYPRLSTTGTLIFEDSVNEIVSGDTWMDHEWSETKNSNSSLIARETAWDWLCLSADDGSDFVSFNFRESQGSISETTALLRSNSGQTFRFEDNEKIQMNALTSGFWTSPDSGIRYPLEWKINFPNGFWIVKPIFKEQEFDGQKTTGMVYWEGMVTATGEINGKKRTAKGYLELKGYDKVSKWWKN